MIGPVISRNLQPVNERWCLRTTVELVQARAVGVQNSVVYGIIEVINK